MNRNTSLSFPFLAGRRRHKLLFHFPPFRKRKHLFLLLPKGHSERPHPVLPCTVVVIQIGDLFLAAINVPLWGTGESGSLVPLRGILHAPTVRLDLKTWMFTDGVNMTGLTGFGTYTPFISVVSAFNWSDSENSFSQTMSCLFAKGASTEVSKTAKSL